MRKITRATSKKKKFSIRGILTWIGSTIYRLCAYPPTLIIMGVMAAWLWFYQSGTMHLTQYHLYNAGVSLSHSAGLTLEDIYLEGKKYSNDKDVINAMNVSLGDALPFINIEHIKTNLENLEWISYAVVERLYPSTLSVRIIERSPLALWQNNGLVSLIDTQGKVIYTDNLEPFKDLLLLVGEDAPSHTHILLSILDHNKDAKKLVSSAVRVGQRRWDIHLHNGLVIKLPENNPQEAWKQLISLHHKSDILNKTAQIIDLRIEHKMYYTPTVGP